MKNPEVRDSDEHLFFIIIEMINRRGWCRYGGTGYFFSLSKQNIQNTKRAQNMTYSRTQDVETNAVHPAVNESQLERRMLLEPSDLVLFKAATSRLLLH